MELIRIGVTGHRNLRREDEEAEKEKIRKILRRLKARHKGAELWLLDSMAEGADLICYQVAKEEQLKIAAALPMEKDETAKDFLESEERWQKLFSEAVETSEQVFTVPDAEGRAPEGGSLPALRNYRYRQAGIYVTSHADYLIALWDGKPGGEGRCGTADTVEFFRSGYLRENQQSNGEDIHRKKALFLIRAERAEGSNDGIPCTDANERSE